MNGLRFLAPSLCVFFGLLCVIWGLAASSSALSERIGGAFFGVLFLFLAYMYVHFILPRKQ